MQSMNPVPQHSNSPIVASEQVPCGVQGRAVARGRSSTRGSAATAPMNARRAMREEERISVARSTLQNNRTFDCEMFAWSAFRICITNLDQNVDILYLFFEGLGPLLWRLVVSHRTGASFSPRQPPNLILDPAGDFPGRWTKRRKGTM